MELCFGCYGILHSLDVFLKFASLQLLQEGIAF